MSPCTIIALVSSVGGLEATRLVLAALPTDLPASVVVLQHLAPDGGSQLPFILAAHATMPVSQVEDGESPRPGHVHVAPAGFHTLVTPGLRFSVVRSGPFPPSRPSADLLLTTMAMALGRRAVAVILTGRGNDGATGASVVRAHGGYVLTTDEPSSTAFSMPAQTIARPGVRPEVVALHDLPRRLHTLARARDVAGSVRPHEGPS